MIVTVTMNPAIDKTVEIDSLLAGGLNRIRSVEYDAGGKGINVSKTIRELGGESIATGFLGGNAGKTIESVLNDKKIKNDFIWVEGETRTNTKVFERNGNVTELFRNSLDAVPDIIKPNRVELEEYAGLDYRASEDELVSLAEGLLDKGIGTVAVSMGKSGAMFVRRGYKVKCPALSVKAHSTVGAGDAMVAALAYAWNEEMDEEATVRLCIATSAGAVTTIGTKPPARELVDELQKQVVIKGMESE